MSAEDEEEFEGIMTDADFEAAIDELRNGDNGDMSELLKIMNENQMISWDEAERIMGDFDDTPVKSSLPPQTRPTEPENDTNVDEVIRKLLNNDPKLLAINLNNMKRTPVPQIKRIIEALRENTYCEKLCLANMGLYDNDIANVIDVVEHNESLKHINVETNYLSGDFFAKLFQAALNNETLEEVKAVNQGVSFATTAEKDIIKAITTNTGLLKVSINLRLPEGRHKIENATIRNQDIRRELRRRQRLAEAAEAAAALEAEKKAEATVRRKSRSFVAPIGAATSPKITPKPEADTSPIKVPMRVYRKQSIPTTDAEATSSAASSKPASPTKKAAPVEEKKPTAAATPTAPATRKWGKKDPEVLPETTAKTEPEKPAPAKKWGRKEPESDASDTNKSEPEKPAPAKKWGRKEPEILPETTTKIEPEKPAPTRKWGKKESESDASDANKSESEKSAPTKKWGRKEPEVPAKKPEEEKKPIPARKWGKPAVPEVKEKEPMGVYPRSKIASISSKLTDEEQKRVNTAAKKTEDENKATAETKKIVPKIGAKPEVKPVNSLKTKTDSSDAEKLVSSANEEDGAPKKKKIIKKKIIVKKIVKKKKSTPNESEADDKTATESEREEAAPTPEPPVAPAKKIPPPVLPKSGANRFGSNLR